MADAKASPQRRMSHEWSDEEPTRNVIVCTEANYPWPLSLSLAVAIKGHQVCLTIGLLDEATIQPPGLDGMLALPP